MSLLSGREKSIQKRMQKCRHFTGTINETCKAGVNYKEMGYDFITLRETNQELPCMSGSHDCPLASFYTRQEAEQRMAEVENGLKQWQKDLAANICPTHKTPMVKRQVGRCVYAEPCGCRLYQGKA